MRFPRCLAAVVLCSVAGCAQRTPAELPEGGTLTVGVTASGPGIGRMVFDVRVDNATLGRVKADGGIFTARDVAPGAHVVALTGLPAACRVEGSAERAITISAGRTTAIRFAVRCSATAHFPSGRSRFGATRYPQ